MEDDEDIESLRLAALASMAKGKRQHQPDRNQQQFIPTTSTKSTGLPPPHPTHINSPNKMPQSQGLLPPPTTSFNRGPFPPVVVGYAHPQPFRLVRPYDQQYLPRGPPRNPYVLQVPQVIPLQTPFQYVRPRILGTPPVNVLRTIPRPPFHPSRHRFPPRHHLSQQHVQQTQILYNQSNQFNQQYQQQEQPINENSILKQLTSQIPTQQQETCISSQPVSSKLDFPGSSNSEENSSRRLPGRFCRIDKSDSDDSDADDRLDDYLDYDDDEGNNDKYGNEDDEYEEPEYHQSKYGNDDGEERLLSSLEKKDTDGNNSEDNENKELEDELNRLSDPSASPVSYEEEDFDEFKLTEGADIPANSPPNSPGESSNHSRSPSPGERTGTKHIPTKKKTSPIKTSVKRVGLPPKSQSPKGPKPVTELPPPPKKIKLKRTPTTPGKPNDEDMERRKKKFGLVEEEHSSSSTTTRVHSPIKPPDSDSSTRTTRLRSSVVVLKR